MSPVFIGYCVIFKVREEAEPAAWTPGTKSASGRRRAGLSKLNSMGSRPPGGSPGSQTPIQIRSTFLVAEQSSVVAGELNELGGARTLLAGEPAAAMSVAVRCPLISGLPRKEVIQPQLPLRLPCYDFTPVASPTFDGSSPCGLGHRLRVLLTPMV